MFIVLGASGHVGAAVAKTLIAAGEPVTAVLHNSHTAPEWEMRGAATAVVDVLDTDSLRGVLRTGTRVFLLNPPADPATDTDVGERMTALSIARAVDGSGLEKAVAASTMGAQPGVRCGDLNTLYEFEQALVAADVPVVINRGAYYFSNWDLQLDEARTGRLTTMLPADLTMPMVAPVDLGEAAAKRLMEPSVRPGTHNVEGPNRYSPRDVAKAFARSLGRDVELVVLPRSDWVDAYKAQGFSQAAAESYAKMTAVTVDDGFDPPQQSDRGSTTLDAYLGELASRSAEPRPS
ncbi:MAG: NAD(P)H-binding protein [Caulobacter sp.]